MPIGCMTNELSPVGLIVAGIVFTVGSLYNLNVPYIGIMLIVGLALLLIGIFEKQQTEPLLALPYAEDQDISPQTK